MISKVLLAVVFAVTAHATAHADGDSGMRAPRPTSQLTKTKAPRHRFILERSLHPGALDSLGAVGVKRIVETNQLFDVEWLQSYTNADKTRSFCVYEGPVRGL